MMSTRAIDRTSTAARIGLRLSGLALAAALLLPVTPAGAQKVVAFVYGEPITALDIDQRARIIEAFSRKRPARKEVLEELIDQKIKLHQARRLDIDIETAAVNREYANMARRAGRRPTRRPCSIRCGRLCSSCRAVRPTARAPRA